MSYRCQACDCKCPPGQPRLTHRLLRPNGQIERELGVCRPCQGRLARGEPLAALRREAERREALRAAALPAPQQAAAEQVPPKPQRRRALLGEEL